MLSLALMCVTVPPLALLCGTCSISISISQQHSALASAVCHHSKPWHQRHHPSPEDISICIIPLQRAIASTPSTRSPWHSVSHSAAPAHGEPMHPAAIQTCHLIDLSYYLVGVLQEREVAGMCSFSSSCSHLAPLKIAVQSSAAEHSCHIDTVLPHSSAYFAMAAISALRPFQWQLNM
jgi:hypothetical protein